MSTPTKPRISLEELESVEIPDASLDDPGLEASEEAPAAPTVPVDDSPELSQLPAGVSVEVARLLGVEERPEAAEPGGAVASAPEEPNRAGRAGTIIGAAATVAIVAGAAWLGTRPPELDPTPYEATEVVPAPPGEGPAEIGFQQIPEPVVVEAAEPATRAATRRRSSGRSGRVTGADLF